MANWLSIACNEIISAVRGTAIIIADKLEADAPYTAIDFTDDQYVTKRAVLGMLPNNVAIVSIPAGSAIPFLIDMTGPLYLNIAATCTPQVELFTNGNFATATKAKPVYDVQVIKDYVDNTHTALTQLSVYGYPDDANPAITQFDLQLILK